MKQIILIRFRIQPKKKEAKPKQPIDFEAKCIRSRIFVSFEPKLLRIIFFSPSNAPIPPQL